MLHNFGLYSYPMDTPVLWAENKGRNKPEEQHGLPKQHNDSGDCLQQMCAGPGVSGHLATVPSEDDKLQSSLSLARQSLT